MGYYSTFKVVDTNVPKEVLCERLNNFSQQYDWADPGWELYKAYDGSENFSGYDATKWYDWVTDLKQYALHYPEDYFIVLRHGEESPDMSRVVVKNGKAYEQFPYTSWPPVDEIPVL